MDLQTSTRFAQTIKVVADLQHLVRAAGACAVTGMELRHQHEWAYVVTPADVTRGTLAATGVNRPCQRTRMPKRIHLRQQTDV
jgi:hypothetical protein